MFANCLQKQKPPAKSLCKWLIISDPGGIRTHDPQLRRLLLYPTELPDRFSGGKITKIMIAKETR
jgi:hypothetical protein